MRGLGAGFLCAVLGVVSACGKDGGGSGDPAPAPEDTTVGPRGATGPDAPLTDAEVARFAQRVAVTDRTASGVQAACSQAVSQGVGVVFLPAGEYVFSAEVGVPGGLTILGEGSGTLIRTAATSTHLFSAAGNRVRFTRMKLQGADATTSTSNDTHGIDVGGRTDVRIDHCEFSGFSYATNFSGEATAQIDHCTIHHNLRDGLGYGAAIYSGAYVLITDNEFSQNRHSLASNGALDWSSGETDGIYRHIPGVRKTHWEFNHNHVAGDDLTTYQLAVVDTHPGMDGTFVAERNVFEDVRMPFGIRDGSGLIRGNLFRNIHGASWRPWIAVYIGLSTHNGIPVEGAMPHHIYVSENTFDFTAGPFERYVVETAQNIYLDGTVVASTIAPDGYPEPTVPRLQPMGEDGVLRW